MARMLPARNAGTCVRERRAEKAPDLPIEELQEFTVHVVQKVHQDEPAKEEDKTAPATTTTARG